MKYLVSCECNTYQCWQMELLIESFKMQGLQNDLYIVVSGDLSKEEFGKVDHKYTKNLRRHPDKQVFLAENYGKTEGNAAINKAYAMLSVAKEELISQPICLIEPDMILYKPVVDTQEQVSFQIDLNFTKKYLEDEGIRISEELEAMLKAKEVPDYDQWFPIGHVYVFNGAPVDMFEEVVKWFRRLDDGRKLWDLGRAAWARAFMDWYGHLTFGSSFEYEMTLLDQGLEHNFIHYKHGLPPMFHKNMYKFDQPVILGPENPYVHFLEHNPTTATNYVQQVVKSYLERK